MFPTKNQIASIKNQFYFSPKLIQLYVSIGIKIANIMVSPLNKLLKHLLVAQGIDPNTKTGQKFQQDLEDIFNGDRSKDYDDGINLSWVNKKFQQIRGELPELDLSQEDFTKMTDVSKTLDVEQTTPPLTIAPSPLDALADLFKIPYTERVGQVYPKLKAIRENERELVEEGFGTDVKGALLKLIEIAEGLEENEELNQEEIVKLMKRTDDLRNVKEIVSSEILKRNQENFESLKRVVLKHPINQNIKKPIQERHVNGRFKSAHPDRKSNR